MKIAVLGAGAMGSAAAVLLGRHPEVDLLVLDVDASRAESVAGKIASAEARAFDANSEELTEILGAVQAVASCLPYKLNLIVMEAALAAGCHYADLGGLFDTTLLQLKLDEPYRKAGVSAVLGIGSAPGLTNVLARLGADRLDRAVSIDLVDGAIEEDGGGFGVPYSAETILDEFSLEAKVFEDGEMKTVPAGSGRLEWEFPAPLGVMEAVHTLHSEPATLPRTIAGVRDVRWRLALPHAIHEGFKLLVSIGLAEEKAVQTPDGPVVPRALLLELLNRLPAPEGPPHDVEYLDVRVSGEKGGRPAVFLGRAKFVPSPEGLSSGAFGTALPITVAARWMAEGRIEPGVHPPESGFDGEEFAAEIAREGVEITLSVEETLTSP